MNENSLIRDIGRSYIVSSFLPAALFITIFGIIFRDFTPQFLKFYLPDNNLFLAAVGFLFGLFSMWLGFLLYSSWSWTFRLFEGYYFKGFIRNLLLFFRRKEFFQAAGNYLLYREAVRTPLPDRSGAQKEIIARFRETIKDEVIPLQLKMPLDVDSLLPTRFGNILRAYESYSLDRYNLRGETIWPRLFQVLPKNMLDQLEERNNQLIFLINSSILLAIIGTICLFLSFVGGLCWVSFPFLSPNQLFVYSAADVVCYNASSPHNFFQNGFINLQPLEYFILAIIFLFLARMVYNFSLVAAENIGQTVKAGVDLHRFELLQKFYQRLPESISIEDEKQIWDNVSDFFGVGDALGTEPMRLHFSFEKGCAAPSGASSGQMQQVNLNIGQQAKVDQRTTASNTLKPVKKKKRKKSRD